MFFLSIAIFSSACFSMTIDSSILAKLEKSNEDSYIPILLSVERPGRAEIIAYAKRLPMSERRNFAIAELKRLAQEFEAPILIELRELELTGSVKNIYPMWLGGSISFEIKSSFLMDFVKTEGIDLVIDNTPSCLINRVENNLWLARPEEPAEAMAVSTAMTQVNADDAWALGITGERVLIAILDSGVRYTHDDLESHMWINDDEIASNGSDDDMNGYTDDYYGYDFVNSDGDPWDDYGHGTSCAGLASGDGTAGNQTGTAPDALIMALKVIDSTGSGIPSDVNDAVQYAVDMGANVLSISLGWEDPTEAIREYYRSVFEDVLATGVIAAVSAGNGRSSGGHYAVPNDISAPADGPSPWQSGASSNTAIVAVGAVDYAGTGIANFSSYGPTEWNTDDYTDFPYPAGLIKPEISAPGQYVTATSYEEDNRYNFWFNGTSAACPIVAGAMALVLSKNPSLSPEEIDSLLRFSATDMGVSGHDTLFGAGLLNCDELIDDTPLPTFPILSIEDHSIDDSAPVGNGSGVFDADETVKLIIEVYNRGASASAVTVTAIIAGDPYISIVDATSDLGTIATGATASDTSDPITLSAALGTPAAHLVYVQITMTSGAYSFVDTIQISTGVYPRNYANHNTPTLATTVTNFGEFGYYDPTASSSSIMGQGFEFGDTNTLYGGGFFISTAYDSVFTGENGNTSEFLPLRSLVLEASSTDTSFYTSYATPVNGLIIDQKSTTCNTSPNEDFIIMRFTVKNYSDLSFHNLYIGFYLDFDIHVTSDGTTTTWFDRAQYSSSDQWVNMWDEASTPRFTGYVGIVGLSGIAHGSVIDNSSYIYPEGMGWDDTVKYNFMSGDFSIGNGSPADDWSIILSEGPLTIPAWGNFVWAIAVIAGTDYSDFQTNAASARGLYSTMSVAESYKPYKIGITAYPNPFNSSVKISFDTPREAESPNPYNENAEIAPLKVEVFDLSGRYIAQLPSPPKISSEKKKTHSFALQEKESEEQMRTEFIWTPSGDITSGVYFVRARIGNNQTALKRLVYLK
ncbi:S8 family serine peptidase [bacterium]|nr:S8 family serine peptidase [bacterium]